MTNEEIADRLFQAGRRSACVRGHGDRDRLAAEFLAAHRAVYDRLIGTVLLARRGLLVLKDRAFGRMPRRGDDFRLLFPARAGALAFPRFLTRRSFDRRPLAVCMRMSGFALDEHAQQHDNENDDRGNRRNDPDERFAVFAAVFLLCHNVSLRRKFSQGKIVYPSLLRHKFHYIGKKEIRNACPYPGVVTKLYGHYRQKGRNEHKISV